MPEQSTFEIPEARALRRRLLENNARGATGLSDANTRGEIENDPYRLAVKYALYTGQVIAVAIPKHPFDYAKTLIQLGYEPLAPKADFTITGKPALYLPSVFTYVKYIKDRDGLSGLYRGFRFTLANQLISSYTADYTYELLDYLVQDKWFQKRKRRKQWAALADESEPYPMNDFLEDMFKESCARTLAVIITHPLHVMTTRCFAQFVGGETLYNTFTGAIREIYTRDGWTGFFAGVGLRLVADLIVLWASYTAAYAVKQFITDDSLTNFLTRTSVQFVVGTHTYPYSVVGKMLELRGARVKLASTPYMPPFKSWQDCWLDLSATGELKRGSTLFFRKLTDVRQFEKFGFAVNPTGGLPKSVFGQGSQPGATARGLGKFATA